MDGFSISGSSPIQFFNQNVFRSCKLYTLYSPSRKHRKLSIFSSKDEPDLDEWDRMELKFGRMIGENPKLTMAKVMGRKLYPGMSYLEIEKLMQKRKGKPLHEDIREIPFDLPDRMNRGKSVQGLNLVRPSLKKGVKFESTSESFGRAADISSIRSEGPPKESKSRVPDVNLRKPSRFVEDDGMNGNSRFGLKSNPPIRVQKDVQKERISDVPSLKKPEFQNIRPEPSKKNDLSDIQGDIHGDSDDTVPEVNEGAAIELQTQSLPVGGAYESAMPMDTLLKGKPKRFDRLEKPTDQKNGDEASSVKYKSLEYPSELENFVGTSPIKENEENDWAKAEELVKTGGRAEVELISSSIKGFVAAFGSLIGFLPYRNLAARWKFLAFESWLRKKGLDPSNYRQSLGVIGKYDATTLIRNTEQEEDRGAADSSQITVTPDMKLEEHLMIYDLEKENFLSSFIGQKIKVGVLLANRTSRKLILTIKPKEKEELAQLSVGDIVKCSITKVTYFGIFVEVQGVPALIHQTEVYWDGTLDPSTYFQVGQILEAKVYQLDFALERIFLSLKEVTPDPLMGALEAVIRDKSSIDGELQEAEADAEWTEVESLMRELKQIEGIQSVSKGRYFLSPGLVPTFQVYMASMVDDQYKLLARAGNRVQEVLVQTSLSKQELKAAILTCANRVQ